MTLAVCAVVICCTTYIGFGVAAYYAKREKLYFELNQFCGRLSADIGFLLTPLEQIYSAAAEECQSELSGIASLCAGLIKSGEALTVKILEEKLSSRYIKREEKNLICQFFCMLGKSDAKTQIESINAYRQRFAEFESVCAAERKKYSPMYKKLGFLLGAAVCLFAL
jgi:stage III sporulation protein AB